MSNLTIHEVKAVIYEAFERFTPKIIEECQLRTTTKCQPFLQTLNNHINGHKRTERFWKWMVGIIISFISVDKIIEMIVK